MSGKNRTSPEKIGPLVHPDMSSKYGTGLNLGTLPMCPNITIRVNGAWIKRYCILCSKTYNTLHRCHNFRAGSRQAARAPRICERRLLFFCWYGRYLNNLQFFVSLTQSKLSWKPFVRRGWGWSHVHVCDATFSNIFWRTTSGYHVNINYPRNAGMCWSLLKA